MNFLDNILANLEREPRRVVLEELRPAGRNSVTAVELRQRIAAARGFLLSAGLRKSDRCVLLAANSIEWAAFDLAAMSSGIIVVPLYARQAPAELAAMTRDCQPALIVCGDAALRDATRAAWPEAPQTVLLGEAFSAEPATAAPEPEPLSPSDPITIIYTSGTSGDAKGVILNEGNLTHMLGCITAQLDLLMGQREAPDRVFHYLPFCFAGSWLLLLSCLSRRSELRLCTDLTRLADDLRSAAPDYCLNVPALLERMRSAIEGQITKRGGAAAKIFFSAKRAWLARRDGTEVTAGGALSLALARALMFPTIRKKLGPHLRALICGSAPLALETQLFFVMLGLPVLQVYGLTETTGICTMDDPRRPEPGAVGAAIAGIEMKLGDGDEILVRGPNVFPGYWNRPQETAKVLANGWFHSGDQGEQTPSRNWRIIGRLKNLLILNSGHNIAPEPLEERLVHAIPKAQQVVLFGHGRSYLTALITGDVPREAADSELARLNQTMPHYRQIRAFHVEPQPLTIESGLLTANGKLRRDAIAAHYVEVIETMYRRDAK